MLLATIENIDIKIGDEVYLKNNDHYDILTVLSVKGDYVECFEYNPKKAFTVKKDEVEII